MSDDNSQQIAAAELRSFIERLEKLDEEKKAVVDDRKDVVAELKGKGYDAKAVARVIALRKKTKEERDEEDGVLSTYLDALGML
jgi:uncharacterized protein (UPF0335 family)